MKFYIISGILLLLGLFTEAHPSCKSSPCIGVDIYYESLGGDSINFITEQLAPTYSAFKDHLDLNFIPYGKANQTRNETGKWVFTCQHGEAECKDNKAQACALNTIEKTLPPESKQEYSFNLILCSMLRNSSNHSISSCAEHIGLSVEAQRNITNCVESSVGDDLLAAYGNRTHSLESPLQIVPTIVVNRIRSKVLEYTARLDFEGIICEFLGDERNNLTYCFI